MFNQLFRTRNRLFLQLAASARVPPREMTYDAQVAQDVKSRYAVTLACSADNVKMSQCLSICGAPELAQTL